MSFGRGHVQNANTCTTTTLMRQPPLDHVLHGITITARAQIHYADIDPLYYSNLKAHATSAYLVRNR